MERLNSVIGPKNGEQLPNLLNRKDHQNM